MLLGGGDHLKDCAARTPRYATRSQVSLNCPPPRLDKSKRPKKAQFLTLRSIEAGWDVLVLGSPVRGEKCFSINAGISRGRMRL